MAQELIIREDGSFDVSSLNKTIENQYIAMGIRVSKVKASKGNVFKSVKAYMCLDCYSVDGDYEGEFSRWIDVHFTRDAFKNTQCDIKAIDDLQTGTLYVLSKNLQAPSSYRPEYEKDKDGNEVLDSDGERKIKYPQIWVKGGIIGFIPYAPSQDKFNRKPKKHNEAVDAETGEVKSDEDLRKEAENLTNE